jgi:aspartate 1-decarboxylase
LVEPKALESKGHMTLQILKAKIQEVKVTESNINYPGSISLSEEFLNASGIKQFELVHVNNKTNGNRITTYAVRTKRKKYVSINGAASRLFKKGDIIHVLAYAYMNEKEAETFFPVLVITDHDNNIIESKPYVLD